MSGPFKAGDRVRALVSDWDITIGREYTLTSAGAFSVDFVDNGGDKRTRPAREFELVTLPIDWMAPLEHVDGTPLVLLLDNDEPNPTAIGNYLLVREDGGRLTEAQTGASYTQCMIVRPNGYGWAHHDTGLPLIRNRAAIAAPATSSKEEATWGDPIEVNGKRPEWLRDEKFSLTFTDGTGGWINCESGYWPDYTPATHIRLPADHPYYLATSRGFTYWPGGESAPEDWDGETSPNAIWRDGSLRTHGCTWWGHQGDDCDIIGYKRKACASAQAVAVPSEEIPTPAQRETAALVAENARLARELKSKERGKAYATRLHKVENERLTTTLAEVTADRDEWIAAFRDLNHRLQRQEMAARETLRMSALSGAHWAAVYQRAQGELDALSARPAPDKGEEAEYVFGPWVDWGKGDATPSGSFEHRDADGRVWGVGYELFFTPNTPFADDLPAAYRRAYRIGEWHDCDGLKGNPLAGDCKVKWENTAGCSAICLASSLAWGGDIDPVRRFRPLAANHAA